MSGRSRTSSTGDREGMILSRRSGLPGGHGISPVTSREWHDYDYHGHVDPPRVIVARIRDELVRRGLVTAEFREAVERGETAPPGIRLESAR